MLTRNSETRTELPHHSPRHRSRKNSRIPQGPSAPSPSQQLPNISNSHTQRFFVGVFMYIFSLTSSKLSIALQYRRIFTDGKTSLFLWLIIALIITNCIWPFFTNLFFCNPVRKFWELETPGTCLDRQGVYFSIAGANIATSLILLVTPLPAIWRLQMRLRTRICLCFIFSFGVL